jgi:hypothetical protein
LCRAKATIALIQKPQGTKAEHTAISFEVEDAMSEVKALEQRGVIFEDYDLPGLKTVEHVCVLGSDRAAWFKDTEGNILCVHQSGARPRSSRLVSLRSIKLSAISRCVIRGGASCCMHAFTKLQICWRSRHPTRNLKRIGCNVILLPSKPIDV